MDDDPYLGSTAHAIDLVAQLTNWLARMVDCPNCGATSPTPCQNPHGTCPARIALAEEPEGTNHA